MAARLVLKLAAEVEEASMADYRRLVERAADPAVRDVLQAIAAEEERHLARVRQAASGLTGTEMTEAQEQELPSRAALLHNVGSAAGPFIEHAIEHETATVRFYEELGRLTHIPGLRQTFRTLAAEETAHTEKLRALTAA